MLLLEHISPFWLLFSSQSECVANVPNNAGLFYDIWYAYDNSAHKCVQERITMGLFVCWRNYGARLVYLTYFLSIPRVHSLTAQSVCMFASGIGIAVSLEHTRNSSQHVLVYPESAEPPRLGLQTACSSCLQEARCSNTVMLSCWRAEPQSRIT